MTKKTAKRAGQQTIATADGKITSPQPKAGRAPERGMCSDVGRYSSIAAVVTGTACRLSPGSSDDIPRFYITRRLCRSWISALIARQRHYSDGDGRRAL